MQYKPIMHNFCNNCFQDITANVSESVGSATCTNPLCRNDLTEKSLVIHQITSGVAIEKHLRK